MIKSFATKICGHRVFVCDFLKVPTERNTYTLIYTVRIDDGFAPYYYNDGDRHCVLNKLSINVRQSSDQIPEELSNNHVTLDIKDLITSQMKSYIERFYKTERNFSRIRI